ncbi:BNR Asp-box repeat domain-containing protein [Fusarium pseudocircinatum]|uniref:BNR Asp-box repeat domain-containing protein n=1 Tax=Fusarium pseudocircinatum TaxID=56676 RepID=A0A8H5P0B6_9HYPO|nr:BNR Asp-box repeat domain-containing protein [Fusarium pseudocircinatum]
MLGSKASLLLSCLALLSPASCRAIEERAVADHAVTFQTIYKPPSNYNTPKTLYGRNVQLADGTILATWENYSPEPPKVYFPIYQSKDKGSTWAPLSNVTDTKNGWGLRYQPFLYVLPQAIGKLAKGTILLAGNSIPTDLSKTKIDLYASTDSGKTWKYISNIATGGKAVPDNGETPVWEPFLMVYNNKLVCYYSDQRDPSYGQKLVHQTSSDGVTWDAVVNDVRGTAYSQRPGMTTVAKLPNGKWMMTFEYGGGASPNNAAFPVYYRISDSPLTFDSASNQILTAGSRAPSSSPYLTWSPSGGSSGSLIVTANSDNGIYINTNLGAAGSWVYYDIPQPGAYSRQAMVMDNPDWLYVMSAGYLNGDNWVTDSVFKLPNLS